MPHFWPSRAPGKHRHRISIVADDLFGMLLPDHERSQDLVQRARDYIQLTGVDHIAFWRTHKRTKEGSKERCQLFEQGKHRV